MRVHINPQTSTHTLGNFKCIARRFLMFDFHNLKVYQQTRSLNQSAIKLIKSSVGIDPSLKNQFIRASTSIALNIAEGSAKFSKAEKRNYYSIARGSAFECVAILDLLLDLDIITPSSYEDYQREYQEISKMLYGLIRALS